MQAGEWQKRGEENGKGKLGIGKIMEQEGQRQMSSRGERKPNHNDTGLPVGRERDIYACPVRRSASHTLRPD